MDRGGLAVLGTERHESRRIDNQLRGRSGRQGDPGESRFYLSLEDDLMRMFATKTVGNLMERLSLPDDVPITHRLVTRAIANAQRQVESQNFERRKNVLKYDEVMNKQRQVIYETRRRILEGGDELRDQTLGFLGDAVSSLVAEYCPQGVYPEEWDLEGLFKAISQLYPTSWIPRPSTWRGSTTTSSRTCSSTTPSGRTRTARPSSAPTCCTPRAPGPS